MKLDGLTKQGMIEVLGELQDMVKSPGWQMFIDESKNNEKEHIERMISSSDSEDEKIKGQIQGIRDELSLVDNLIAQLKEVITEKGGE